MNDTYVILTDSTVDLPAELAKELGITVVPLGYTINKRSCKDNPLAPSMPYKAFYDLLRQGETSITTQVNITEWADTAEPFLKQGKDVLIIAFSSGLSGTYQSARIAAEELSEAYPDRKILAVDSLSASMGEGLLVWHAVQRQNAGMDIEELAQWLLDNRLRMCHWFTVDDLNHLKRGGRISGAVALIGSVLGIKPVMHVDDEGHLIPVSKIRGRRQSLDALVDKMAESYDATEPQTVFISHGDAEADANYVAQQIRSRLNVANVVIHYVGPVIGTHSGPGTLAIFFFGSQR